MFFFVCLVVIVLFDIKNLNICFFFKKKNSFVASLILIKIGELQLVVSGDGNGEIRAWHLDGSKACAQSFSLLKSSAIEKVCL
jgi:hypothetical protein